MTERLYKILLIASEVSPFVKTGGIADVVSELARALRKMGHDVRVACPRYRIIDRTPLSLAVASLPVPLDSDFVSAQVLQGTLGADVPIYFIDNPQFFDRDGIYMFADDAERFLFFSRAALEMLRPLGWQPDVIHVNDWQTAIIPNWLKTIYANDPFFRRTASLYTIHNLAYFGTFGERVLEIAGLAQYGFIAHPLVSDDINRELNFMARGILFADYINTVSPTYAREIQTPEFGEGLDPILRARAHRLRGILNGIDYEAANPATDPVLVSRYSPDQLELRAPNKRALQELASFPLTDGLVLAMVSRLNEVKGLDLVLGVADTLLESDIQLVVMGTGEAKYHDALKELERRFPEQVRFFQTFNHSLRQKILAGSDGLLMPSRVEAGGTMQLLAMRYGCIPIVHKVGGLADSVQDYDPTSGTGTGFVFEKFDQLSFYSAIIRAREAFCRPQEWRDIQQRAMRQDFSWEHSAAEYVALYEAAVDDRRRVAEKEAVLLREIERTADLMKSLPARIQGLEDLVYNLWWTWHSDATALLERISPALWEQVNHNPIELLRSVSPARLVELSTDTDWLAHYDRVISAFVAYLNDEATWFRATYPYIENRTIAYFSAEFGLHECLPIYSGGLGVLSGDHIKEASDMGVPLIGIGFLYPQGYFRQELDAEGNQIARYDKLDLARVPALAAKDENNNDLVVKVELPGRAVYAKVWQVRVGRARLYLMDTDIERNAEQDRVLAARLYAGDHEIRIMQEMVLGIGGVRVLRALGLYPHCYHMNEGHSAFLVLELARELVEGGVPFNEAKRRVAKQCIFTTHTPVPAGHDTFDRGIIDKYLGDIPRQLGISGDQFFALAEDNGRFSMTLLGMRFSDQRNGVSQLHGQVARQMWHKAFGVGVEQTPIKHITNGIHTASWLAPERMALYTEFLNHNWYAQLDNPRIWERILDIPNARLWSIQQSRKRALLDFIRGLQSRSGTRQQSGSTAIDSTGIALELETLTIGFARRFATYKRATLILRDFKRLKRILTDPTKPVQLIFAGKAHPADIAGQMMLRAIAQAARDPDLQGRIVLLEDYGIDDARMLVQGVDVWLNTPRRPLEASGTSGQKAALNGVLNLSVLDGWWAEGFTGTNGWAIGDPTRTYSNEAEQDEADALALYTLLENQVVPLYYKRGEDGVPNEWVERCKEAIRTCAPTYSTRRMLKEYTACYINALAAVDSSDQAPFETLSGVSNLRSR